MFLRETPNWAAISLARPFISRIALTSSGDSFAETETPFRFKFRPATAFPPRELIIFLSS
jgi:hypothetical protein